MAKKCDYKVGYGKPPLHSRFQKGRSGNPKGRSKKIAGDECVEALFLKNAAMPITVTVNGKKRTITTLDAVMVRQFGKAMAGDSRAAKELFRLNDRVEAYKKRLAARAEEERENFHREMVDRFMNDFANIFSSDPVKKEDDDAQGDGS